jgi:hypothetical protein
MSQARRMKTLGKGAVIGLGAMAAVLILFARNLSV